MSTIPSNENTNGVPTASTTPTKTTHDDSPLTDTTDNSPLDIDRVAKHLGYPPPPEFEPLAPDFYKDLHSGYPVVDGKDPETNIDSEIYCFYLDYFVKYPILLYASAYSRESDRFSRKISWDIYAKYGKVFYGFISSARMRKTLLQKLNRYRKKYNQLGVKPAEQGDHTSQNATQHATQNSAANSNDTAYNDDRMRRTVPERKKEKELMDQILRLHDRIIDTAIYSGASKRPHKNSKDSAGEAPLDTPLSSAEPAQAVEITKTEDTNRGDHYNLSEESSSANKVKQSRTTSAVSPDPTTNTSASTPTNPTESTVSRVGPPLLGEERASLETHVASNDEVSTPLKRPWHAINDEKYKDREPSIQKLINGTIPSPKPVLSTPTPKPSKHSIESVDKQPTTTTQLSPSAPQSIAAELWEYMNELKKRDFEASVALDSINTDVQMLADQIDYIRHNLEMTIELTRKKREYHNQVYAKVMSLLEGKQHD